ncbi:HET-domain-containing protein [Mytilinidion resinicola]|uniref:HET-domain-containing protein n=1 Tax=Mytilinidion resinicola TaxID=574789 RepID=A0A6A6Z699_9PEZI|nr:HET-domain-containing protein [Mytilinidion resinicola]KAF2815755.1 HET-domain-containing protein [Mytilinidion resinicola]
MWLINTTTLKLEFFVNPEKASYAILSHTWGDEEVIFQELQSLDKASSQKKGFAKIVRICEKARQEGLQYAWVDTCCIDKSSSAELSEAINSMFAWYKDSAVCLAYLEDLPTEVGFEEGFHSCRWLSRGWTLQELIAPQNMEFYDQAWTKRTTKRASTKLLAKVTGVQEAVLADSTNLTSLSVAQRMSWVSRRQTTRAEDIAYCMLGIFDIHIPLIYGEGEKAFMRLQEEIAKQTCDLSLFAWAAPPPEPSSDPHNFRGIFAKSPAEFIDSPPVLANSDKRSHSAIP